MQALFHGLLEDVSFKLYDDHGEELVLRGACLIADGGFLQLDSIIDPGHLLHTVEQTRWSGLLESIRKDVECTFGTLKIRFRILLYPSELRNLTDIEDIYVSVVAFCVFWPTIVTTTWSASCGRTLIGVSSIRMIFLRKL